MKANESIWEYSQVSRYDSQITLAISSFRQLPLDIDMMLSDYYKINLSVLNSFMCLITEKKFLLSLYRMIKQIMKALLLTSSTIVAFVYTCGLKMVVYILVWPTNLTYFMFVEILVEKILWFKNKKKQVLITMLLLGTILIE